MGLDGHLHRWDAPLRKFIQRCRNINETSKSLVERLVEFKICALPVLGYIGSISAPNKATLKEEARALQCITAGLYNSIPAGTLRVAPVCGLGDTVVRHVPVTRQASPRPPPGKIPFDTLDGF